MKKKKAFDAKQADLNKSVTDAQAQAADAAQKAKDAETQGDLTKAQLLQVSKLLKDTKAKEAEIATAQKQMNDAIAAAQAIINANDANIRKLDVNRKKNTDAIAKEKKKRKNAKKRNILKFQKAIKGINENRQICINAILAKQQEIQALNAAWQPKLQALTAELQNITTELNKLVP